MTTHTGSGSLQHLFQNGTNLQMNVFLQFLKSMEVIQINLFALNTPSPHIKSAAIKSGDLGVQSPFEIHLIFENQVHPLHRNMGSVGSGIVLLKITFVAFSVIQLVHKFFENFSVMFHIYCLCKKDWINDALS